MALLPILWLLSLMFALPSNNFCLSISLRSSLCCEMKSYNRADTIPSSTCFHFSLMNSYYSSCLLTFSGEPLRPKYMDCCCFGLGLYFTSKLP